jgi:hypothetical protein
MSSAYSRLSYNDALEISTDVSIMGKKLMAGYLNLVGYLHRFGSVPSGDRALASVLGVTPRFLRDVAWPLLQDRLVLSSDSQRYFDPDITAVRSPRAAAAAPAAPEKSQQQEAAIKRWNDTKERKRQQAEAHAETDADASKAHTNSMRDASETHAETDASASSDASTDASDASHRMPASPPPLKEDSFSQPTEKKESSGGGGTRALASDDMRPHAPTHENRMRSDAETHAETHAPATRPIRPVAIPIPPDWQPPDECRAEAERLGVAVDLEISKFILHCLRDDESSKNWPASFLIWCHRQVEWAKKHSQIEAPIVFKGGKVEKPEIEKPEIDEPIIGTDRDAKWARVQRGLGKGVARNWLGRAEIVGLEDGELTIALPTAFIRDHVAKNYDLRLLALWREEDPDIEHVRLEVATPERRAAAD